jgi:ribonuclease D
VIAAANALPTNGKLLMATSGFHGRGARRYLDTWVEALKRARAMPDAELPPLANRSDGPPQVRSWADRDPVAAARLNAARAAVAALSEEHNVPIENLLTPDYMRRVLWTPPDVPDDQLEGAVGDELRRLGARPWQVDLMAPLIAQAVLHPAENSQPGL